MIADQKLNVGLYMYKQGNISYQVYVKNITFYDSFIIIIKYVITIIVHIQCILPVQSFYKSMKISFT